MKNVVYPIALATAVAGKRGGWELLIEKCPGCEKPSRNRATADANGMPNMANPVRTCNNAGCWAMYEIRLLNPAPEGATGKAERAHISAGQPAGRI